MANTIIGNTEYNAIKEKAYINGTQDNIRELARQLDEAQIRYSGRISDYKSTITVEAADRSAALEIMRSIKEAARKNSPAGNQPQNNIIGNAEYRFIKDKRFVKGETEAILRVADRLTAENISFSGRIYGDNATLTVSGDELQEKVKKYFAEEKSGSETIRTAYMLAQSSVNLEDGYYISEVNVETGDEVQPYRSNYGDIPAFLSVDEAVRYAEGTKITLSNTDGQLNDWRRIEAEAEKEKDRQLNLSRSREIIKRLPMTENGYEEHFIMRDDAVDWIYFNPDGADGEGQFVYTTLYEDDLTDAYNARINTEDYRNFGQSAFIDVIQNGRQNIINADEEDFERLAWDFINSRENKNVIISAPVISGQGYNDDFENIIGQLEDHFDEVRKLKENQLTEGQNVTDEEPQETEFENLVTELDELDSAARREAAQTETKIDTIADYAKDMYEDGDCKYEWNDGLTEWQNISASILSGNTEYIDSWLRDLRSALTYLEDDQNVSVDAVYDKFERYKSQHNSEKENSSHDKIENNVKKTLIINAFGGPGAGKTTACLHIASELKKRGFVAEYVSEYAKDLVWNKNFEMLDGSEEHQKMILAEQKKRMDRLIGQVDFVVTDAPILLNSVYLNSDDKSSYDEALVNLFKQYDNFNLEVIRDAANFEEEGRIHNLEQSQQADNDIRQLLNSNNIYFGTYSHSKIDKVIDNAVVTYKKLTDKPFIIPDIPEKLSLAHYSKVMEISEEQQNSTANDFTVDESLPLSEQLVSVTDEIAKKEAELTELVNKKEYEKVAVIAGELADLGKKSAELKEKIQTEEITVSDVQDLRSIKPVRKSVQNMLDREVAQTPKFEKLLSDEMGEKSAYEMRRSNNEWRNDNSKTVPVIEVIKQNIPANLTYLRKTNTISRGTFLNKDTNLEIIFSKRSIEEIIAKAIQNDKRNIPVEARISAIYQMQELIENSVCFDSQLSEYNPVNSKNKTENTLFMHQLYGLIKYENGGYLVRLSVEESYVTDKKNNFSGTTNRIYNLKDMKITPVEANRIFSPAVGTNTNTKDTSTSVTTITIPQLYDFVKTYDQNFFENPAAPGRTDREAEIKAHEDFSKAMETYSEIIDNQEQQEISESSDTKQNQQNISDCYKRMEEIILSSDIIRNSAVNSDTENFKLTLHGFAERTALEIFNENTELNMGFYKDYSSNPQKRADFEASLFEKISADVQKENFPDRGIEKPRMITLSNDKISYVVVSEVRDALNDLYNGLAPSGEADGGYDWKNYYDAFRAVLDANTHGDIAYPLYNSDAERILQLAYSEDSDTVSDEEFKNALKNLDLVLQNSHLLANPEEKAEQLSFFGEQLSYVSSDEISYTAQKENISPVKNTEKADLEKEEKAAVDYTLTEENYNLQSGAKARFNDNIAAIKALKNIEAEGRKATPAEQKILAKYVGWGGIPQAFDGTKSDWKKEYDELKKLLTAEEYKAAKASTLNAHYTTPTVINAIYSALENMGFKGGKILEPAVGIGNFFGAMPEKMRNNSSLSGVELDSISGRIAMQLYQSANIQINGFEKTDFENESFDAAVGNVPFGSYKLNDKEYNKRNLFIHDYFFAKALDKVRPGGVIAFVTSKGTLDKEKSDVRKYIAERAEFLGAIRLPNTAFKSNAGTEVTSDIIFLQKRERPINIEENPPEWIFRDILPNGIAVNKYFAEHPEMILGEMVEGNKLYGNQADASMCVPIEGADLKEQLARAIKNISGKYREAGKGNTEKEILSEIPCPPDSPKFSFIVQDNTLYYRKSGGTMTRVEMPENSVKRIIAMAEMRDFVHRLLDLQLENSDGRLNEIIDTARVGLNKKYDDFSEKYGLLSSAENKKLFKDDNSYHLLKSLEITDNDGHFLKKADIFTKNTINPKKVVDRCDNAEDALILSISEKMCVDFDYMSILTGKSEEELIAELGNKIFQNPYPLRQMRWESADEYLTGNIRQKLAAAEKAGLQRNVDALNAVMPKRIEAADISVKLGSAWIDTEYVRQFIVETIKPDFITGKNISVTYSDVTDKWRVDGWQGGYANTLATETYGTAYMNAYQIIEASLNMKKAEVRERVKDENGNFITDKNGRYVLAVNREKTMIVQEKQDELKRKFQDWIFADPNRRETLVQLYNEKFNSIRLREYDGSHLNFVGMNSAITLKEHQKNAVARALYSNVNTLLAHEVGGGKTYEMVAIAMEGKRLGLHNKSLITAPNALTEQWGEAFRTLYPNANVLVATEKDFKKENRRDLFAKIATGDWDAVIIGHSQFDMIHLSREREIDMLTSELDRLEASLNEMKAEGNGRSFSVKQIEKTIKSYEEKIERLLSKTPEDDMLCFEKLGVDKIFVDESQAYKNLDTPTKMQNVSGIGSGGSGRSMQLLMKCKYLDEITGGKGCIFASGTPISNSMSELYTLMRYLQADKLSEMGIKSFDRWASVFGETTSSMELSPEGNGKYQMKTRFAKFQNLPELMNIFKECADIKTAEALNLDRPDFEMHNINVPATKIQTAMIKELGERAKAIRSGAVEPTEDNMCKLTVDGRKIGLDQRCMNPNLPDDPNSKVNVCIRNVFDIWRKTAENKSTQMIFCDLATPQPPLNENRFYVYRKGENGEYSSVYSAKLSEKDTPEKIAKRLNEKPPKEYNGGVSDGDIIVTKNVDYESETAFRKGFVYGGDKLSEMPNEMWEMLHTSPVEPFETERRFCVYDEIKNKLVSMGVPEKEIAFIHDAEKAVDKQLLFDKMNKGEIRVLIGSTQKCGAGMNAQERMIALHDIDAPMRPSDMSQRHGRIIRQGNTNKKVDIYRYTTDKTFDAYLYQMLENKQKFISQIMTDKSPVRSCEDVDEIALDYAEVKALCAGNPLIKEKIDLETEITKLKVLKSAFLSQKYSLQDKAYKILPERKNNAEIRIEKMKSDLEKCGKINPLTNEDGKKYYPVTVEETVYHDKEQAGEAIRQAVLNSEKITEGKECKIGSYRGLEMSAFLDTLNKCVKVNLSGSANHYGEINMNADVKASGNIIRLDNIVNGIALELQKSEEYLQSINADIEEAKAAAGAEFPQERELSEKEKRLAEVDALLSSEDVHADNGKDLYAALIEICPELKQSSEVYCKLEKDADSGIEPFIIERSGNTVFAAHTYVQNGDLMYDPAIEFSFDTEAETAYALTYELSSMGIYKDLRGDENKGDQSNIEEMALNTLFENVKAYDYEVKELRVGEKQEKEIDCSQER